MGERRKGGAVRVERSPRKVARDCGLLLVWSWEREREKRMMELTLIKLNQALLCCVGSFELSLSEEDISIAFSLLRTLCESATRRCPIPVRFQFV